jgi:hypothetical protein
MTPKPREGTVSIWTDRIVRSWLCLAVLTGLGAVWITGCGSDTPTGQGSQPSQPNRETPDNLLDFYIYAFEHEDLDMYGEALDDGFVFEFTPAHAESLGLPPDNAWWGKTEELATMHEMFQDTTVTSLEMELTKVDDWSHCESGMPAMTITGLCVRVDPEIRIGIAEPGREPWTYIINDVYFDMMVVLDPKYPNQDLWVILSMKELIGAP